ncbi:MAG: Xaa-Pro aminopeptidase, partial [Bacteroidota bacterium]
MLRLPMRPPVLPRLGTETGRDALPWLLACALLALTASVQAQTPDILPMRERAEVMDRWLHDRLDTLVPSLMRREGIEMWIVTAREYD